LKIRGYGFDLEREIYLPTYHLGTTPQSIADTGKGSMTGSVEELGGAGVEGVGLADERVTRLSN
jgi:hypothetical protein